MNQETGQCKINNCALFGYTVTELCFAKVWKIMLNQGDPFWPVKNWPVIYWPVKFDQLSYANLIGPRGFQNLTGQLVFTHFDTGGNYLANSWMKKAQKQTCHEQLQQMSLHPFLLILDPLCDHSQKIKCKFLCGLFGQCLI